LPFANSGDRGEGRSKTATQLRSGIFFNAYICKRQATFVFGLVWFGLVWFGLVFLYLQFCLVLYLQKFSFIFAKVVFS
jgi:hypothetical protein